MNRRRFVTSVGAGLGAAFTRRSHARVRDRFAERWSWAMGQSVHVMVFASTEAEGLDACAAALAELRRVEEPLTLFDDASELCELNRAAGRRALRVREDLRQVLRLAERFRRETDGAFNVGVEPLMRSWGFHRPRAAAPSNAEILEAREAVATALVEMDGSWARLPRSHTQLDFGGIGVGYGIDRALAVLRGRGITRALIDVSGDVGTIGAPPGESGWPVGIADPDRRGHTVAETRLCDEALCTSANTESTERYGALIAGHVMNPATGWPAHALKQVSVVARAAVQADALSTAMLVSGRRHPSALRVFAVAGWDKRKPEWGPTI